MDHQVEGPPRPSTRAPRGRSGGGTAKAARAWARSAVDRHGGLLERPGTYMIASPTSSLGGENYWTPSTPTAAGATSISSSRRSSCWTRTRTRRRMVIATAEAGRPRASSSAAPTIRIASVAPPTPAWCSTSSPRCRAASRWTSSAHPRGAGGRVAAHHLDAEGPEPLPRGVEERGEARAAGISPRRRSRTPRPA